MNPITKLALIVIVVALAFWLVTRFRDRTPPDRSGAPVAVDHLPDGVRASIDHAIRSGRQANAVKIYCDATSAPPAQAKQAVDRRARQLS